jgi:NAD(P)-dependent dehydrogenase (short-subunit alcohol dehydrogenase family)
VKHELRVMREQGSDAIVKCSSLGGLVGPPQRAAYHGTKHSVLGMTKSAGVEYAPRGIRSGCYAAANSIWILIGADLVAEAQRPRDETRDKRRLQCSRTGAFRAREGMSVPCAAKFLTNRG